MQETKRLAGEWTCRELPYNAEAYFSDFPGFRDAIAHQKERKRSTPTAEKESP